MDRPMETTMRSLNAETLAGCIAGARVEGDGRALLTGITHDSRRVTPGCLFVAVKGARFDGNRFAARAVEDGAAAVMSETAPPGDSPSPRAWIRVDDVRRAMTLAAFELAGRPDSRVPFIGVTGTNGKTTITYLLERIFLHAGMFPGVLGTVSYRYRGEEAPAARTTPESPDIAAFAARVAGTGGGPFLMEVSSHAVSLARVYGVRFHTALFTNLTQDHLDWYGTMEAYADAKRAWFDGRNGPVPGRGVFNLDDPFARELHASFTGERIGTSAAGPADFRVSGYAFTPGGMRLKLEWAGRRAELRTRLTGRGNLHNVLQSFAAAVAYGVDPDAATEALAGMDAVPGRLDEVVKGYPFRVFVDYAHSEDALRNACSILREITPGRLIVVFGCGGDKDRGKRPRMGRAVAEAAHVVIVTSDNPRSEDPEAIIDEIVPGILEVRPDYLRDADRRRAIERAVTDARPGDTLLLAGKGHEREQIIGNRVIPFHDGDVAADAVRRLRGEAR